MSVDYNKYPWLCNANREYDVGCDSASASNVANNESNLAGGVTIEGYDLFGIPCTYYPVSHNIAYDVHYGEDQLEYILRAFKFKGYIQAMPANVRTYQLEGIWGEDLVTMYVANTAFRYFSTYGGTDRNTPEVYEQIIPRIGDLIYIDSNKTFYEIRNVNYYTEAFGLASHTYTLTLKVYKDVKYTISADSPTIADKSDPIYKVAAAELSAQDQYHDILSQNKNLNTLTSSTNVNYFDYLYDPNSEN